MVTLFRIKDNSIPNIGNANPGFGNLMVIAITLGYMLLTTSNAYTWNALGHKLIAQIAYHHIKPQIKKKLEEYNGALNKQYDKRSFVTAAPWLDTLRSANDKELLSLHYINLPFSKDGTLLTPPNPKNIITGINDAWLCLTNEKSSIEDKGFSFRVLIHLIGDIHQPMHAVSEFSKKFPTGDKGGNLVYLKSNPIASNLHAYWDNGGGFLKPAKRYSSATLNKKSYQIEQYYPCDFNEVTLDPVLWANESHKIALNDAYQLQRDQKPSKSYQQKVKKISEQRITLAGCRLASLFNTLVNSSRLKSKA